jgi:hypothetical protein
MTERRRLDRERWMVDRARDRLVVTAAMMQHLHDVLRYGLLPREQAEAKGALILAQLEEALRLVHEASASLRAADQRPSAPEAEVAIRPRAAVQ